jgi:hypothetical protein
VQQEKSGFEMEPESKIEVNSKDEPEQMEVNPWTAKHVNYDRLVEVRLLQLIQAKSTGIWMSTDHTSSTQ